MMPQSKHFADEKLCYRGDFWSETDPSRPDRQDFPIYRDNFRPYLYN